MSSTSAQLFQPINVGPVSLKHRVVLAPMTRFKTTPKLVPFLPLVKDFYTQRASTPGTLVITESTLIAARAAGFPHMPGIFTQDQIDAWKEVVDSVHAQGSFIFMQLVALGRAAMPDVLRADDSTLPLVSASDIPADPNASEKPRPLTLEEIQEYTDLFAQAAKTAVKIGFDGVEVHACNGCLVEQFIQDVSNIRTDKYGGSVENRAKFPLEVVKAIADAIGESRTAIRFSPWSPFLGMGMTDPIPTYTHLVSELKRRYPSLAYLHLIEPRINSDTAVDVSASNAAQSNEPICEIWGPDKPLIRAGGFSRDSAIELTSRSANTLVAFGRHFIANPDLPVRLEKNIALHPYDRSTFYLAGVDEPRGYTDQPFATRA
ncbi:NADH:flavin oxidoreductase/NADH oxidase [Favolaschia claudopus]|uniref:NADH:flavin oxidoreductase/NADH oxidase n=1 Tax=Favolaschia claudopus TaxID=2862362 RepID=A0AAV9Z7K4_9AGAR